MYGALIVDAVLFGCLSKKKIPTKNRFMKPLGEKNRVSRLYSYNNFTAVLYNSFLGCGVIMSHPSHKKKTQVTARIVDGFRVRISMVYSLYTFPTQKYPILQTDHGYNSCLWVWKITLKMLP